MQRGLSDRHVATEPFSAYQLQLMLCLPLLSQHNDPSGLHVYVPAEGSPEGACNFRSCKHKSLAVFVHKQKVPWTWHALKHIHPALQSRLLDHCKTCGATCMCVPAEGTVARRGIGAALPVPAS